MLILLPILYIYICKTRRRFDFSKDSKIAPNHYAYNNMCCDTIYRVSETFWSSQCKSKFDQTEQKSHILFCPNRKIYIFIKIQSLFNNIDRLKINVTEHLLFCFLQNKLCIESLWVFYLMSLFVPQKLIDLIYFFLKGKKIFGDDIHGEIVRAYFYCFSGMEGMIRRKYPVRILSEWNSEDVPRRRHCADRIHRVRIRVSRVPRNADIRTPAYSCLGIFGAFQRTQFLTRHHDAAFIIDRLIRRHSN